MHSLVLFLVLAGTCLAHYRGYEARNLVERDEPSDEAGVLVECPVCEGTDSRPSNEKCDIAEGGKHYKRCEHGTYRNKVCGNRLDCYRGPGEHCSEKMLYDVYGQKCARGFECIDVFHVCTGLDFHINSNDLWNLHKVYRYRLPSQLQDQTKSESSMLLA